MRYFVLIALFVLPAVLLTFDNGHRMLSYAEEDPLEDEVEVEGEVDIEAVGDSEEDEEIKSTASPDADTTLLFIKPVVSGSSQLDLPAGVPVEFLVGFRNKGEQDFIFNTVEASFRYPMDFNFYIQNFSAIVYNKVVRPSQEAILAYSFIPSEALAGRPFGLNVNLNYRDAAGAPFQEAVYNETIHVTEREEDYIGETSFLCIILAAGVVLLLVIGQQTLLCVGRKRPSCNAPVETGTSNPNNVDCDWLPKQTLANLNKEKQKSPKAPKQSPRRRKTKRSTGSD